MPTNFELVMAEYAAAQQGARDGAGRDRERMRELYRRRAEGITPEEELALQLAWMDEDAAAYEVNLDLWVADCAAGGFITPEECAQITGGEGSTDE